MALQELGHKIGTNCFLIALALEKHKFKTASCMWSRKAETGPPWVAEHLGVAKRVRVAFEVNNEPAFGKRAALQLN